MSTDAAAFRWPNGGLQLWLRVMALLKLSAVSLGHSETDTKIKRSAYAAQTLLACYCDELDGLFSAAIPAALLAPCHGGVGLTTSHEGPQGGWDELGRALGSHWASASSLKWFLQDGRWRTI